MVSEEFKSNVSSGDVINVKCALLNKLIIDRHSFVSFDEDLNYASEKLDIIQCHDNKPFEADSEKWDMDYLSSVKIALMDNFSMERITHIKQVINKVLPKEKEIKPVSSDQTENYPKTKRTGSKTISVTPLINESDKNDSKLSYIELSLLVAGGIAVIGGGIAKAPVIMGAGAVALGIDAYIYLKNKE